MGNKQSQPQFNQLMQNLKSEKHSRKLSIRPEQKYKNQLIEAFESSNLPQILKEDIQQCLCQKIDKADYLSTVSVISTLMKNNFTPQAFKSTINIPQNESRQVFIRFNGQKIKDQILERHKKYDKATEAAISQLIPSEQEQSKQKSRIQQNHKRGKFIEKLIKKQINKQYHPFRKLNKIFAQFLVKVFLTQDLNQQQMQQGLTPQLVGFIKSRRSLMKSGISRKDLSDQSYEQHLRKIIHLWCKVVNDSCLKPYKKWVLFYTQMTEPKYNKTMLQILMEQIWTVNQGYLFHIIAMIIDNYKKRLRIPGKIKDQVLVTPALFQIDQPLQIEGHYGLAIYDMSEFTSLNSPGAILQHLYKIKTSICTDIDKYHHLQEKLNDLNLSNLSENSSKVKPVYQINSDNIIGIVNYILYRVRQKIQQIDRQCIFLRILYDDKAYFAFQNSSYMLTTITSAMEFLDGPGFRQLLIEAVEKDDKKYTDVTTDKSKQINMQNSNQLIDSKLSLEESPINCLNSFKQQSPIKQVS